MRSARFLFTKMIPSKSFSKLPSNNKGTSANIKSLPLFFIFEKRLRIIIGCAIESSSALAFSSENTIFPSCFLSIFPFLTADGKRVRKVSIYAVSESNSPYISSQEKTGYPDFLIISDTVDFPLPIPPVIATFFCIAALDF